MQFTRTPQLSAIALTVAALVAACGGGGDVKEETRAQDDRTFTPASTSTAPFAALAAAAGDAVDMSTTSRWSGVLNGAMYRVEVPANWNGKLVMYAHGYRGTGPTLTVSDPSIRRYLIQNGYAWAASSYSTNYYDVRAGVEDTNALALEFNRIAAANGRALPAPSKTYITGHSMGGHIAGAAVEQEALGTARNRVRYDGAVPMCGVMGDEELFNQFAAMQVTAQALAGQDAHPTQRWSEISTAVTSALFTSFPTTPTATGVKFLSVVKHITGGERPLFAQGIAFGGSFSSAYGTFGSDGTVNGILNSNMLDTTRYTYVIDGDAAGTAALNASAQKLQGDPEANRMRRDGLRWIPQVNGEFRVPVVSIHTLGDLFVPFSMQQIYRQRANANGSGNLLVQRAMRGASHCDFTVAEQVNAFDDMIKWERDGIKPAGDDVLTAATVAAPSYGCQFTVNSLGPDDSATTRSLRPAILASTPACPAP